MSAGIFLLSRVFIMASIDSVLNQRLASFNSPFIFPLFRPIINAAFSHLIIAQFNSQPGSHCSFVAVHVKADIFIPLYSFSDIRNFQEGSTFSHLIPAGFDLKLLITHGIKKDL